MREVFMYACSHCGTVKILNTPSDRNAASAQMHCAACHHSAIPEVVAIDFKAHKFVAAHQGET